MKALLLEGGGAKGAYEAGAIKALNQRKMTFDAVGGTSIGAINAAFYVIGNFDDLYDIWLSTDNDDLFGIETSIVENIINVSLKREDIKKTFSALKAVIKNGGVDIDKMMDMMHRCFDEDKFRESNIDFGLNTYNLSDRKAVEVFKKDIPYGKLYEYLISSAYLPVFKHKRIIDDKYYMDGSVQTNCPIDMFINAGYDEIYVIRLWRRRLPFKNSKHAKVHIIKPREYLGSLLLFEPKIAEYRMNLGYYDTLKYLDNLDGNKYYFKNYSEEYYSNLFDKVKYKQIIKKYNKNRKPQSDKTFILKCVEKMCYEQEIERFKVYNIPYLITKLKYRYSGKKNSYYYDFIKNIKVDFE